MARQLRQTAKEYLSDLSKARYESRNTKRFVANARPPKKKSIKPAREVFEEDEPAMGGNPHKGIITEEVPVQASNGGIREQINPASEMVYVPPSLEQPIAPEPEDDRSIEQIASETIDLLFDEAHRIGYNQPVADPTPGRDVSALEWVLQGQSEIQSEMLKSKPSKPKKDEYRFEAGEGLNFYYFRIPEHEPLYVKKWNDFSCGVKMIGKVERFYRYYGIKKIEEVFDVLVNRFNEFGGCYSNGKASFITVSLTDQYEELVNYFYKVAHTATDFMENPNSGNRICVFMLKVK